MKSLKRIFAGLILSVAALGLLSACNQDFSAPAQNTVKPAVGNATIESSSPVIGIGLVDTDQVFSQSLSGKAGIAHLENIGKELQQEFMNLQAEVKEKDENSIMDFQKKAGQLEQRFKAEEQQVMTAIEKLYQESLDKVRQSEKLQLILAKSSALSFADNSDVTAKVVSEMDKTPLSFKPLPVEPSEAVPGETGANSAPLQDDKAAAPVSNSTAKDAAGKNSTATDGKDSKGNDKAKK